MSTGTIFFTQKHKNIPFLPEKRYLWRSGWRCTVQGSRHAWTLKKNIVSNIVSFPPLNYSPSVLTVLCCVGCCVAVMLLLLSLFTLLMALPTPSPPPPSACCRRRHCRWFASRMSPATQTPTAAQSRWRKLSAGRWSPARCWTRPSRPVARAAKVATMMAAPAVAAEVGSRTRLVWSSPPPPKAVQWQQGWWASESRGNKEGNCNGR